MLTYAFFCSTWAKPFFRPDRNSIALPCRVAVKDGRRLGGHPKGLSLTAVSTVAGSGAAGGEDINTACDFPLPLPRVPYNVWEVGAGKPIKNRAFGFIRSVILLAEPYAQ